MFRLRCGLEVHAQLLSTHKLFSGSKTSFQALPNSNVSYFDAALPGAQPKLNMECVELALKASSALQSSVSRTFTFDRKHYMYPDQPSGYQITQHFSPYAHGGYLEILNRDYARGGPAAKIRIKQIQIEQDTGKTVYVDGMSHVDLNRANSGLIELVSEPDIVTPEQAGVFVRKLQALLRHIGVCSGDMETGAMRVDANVSVNGGERCEIKNLFSPSAVVAAIKAEFRRQVDDIKDGKSIDSETRGWDGKNTWKLRGKEGSIDYRYMPDPELPVYTIPDTLKLQVDASLGSLPDQELDILLGQPYNVPLDDAKTLMSYGMEHVQYYKRAHANFSGRDPGLVSNWLVNRWLGKSEQLPPLDLFIDLLKAIDQRVITTTSAKLILKHLLQLADYKNVSVEKIITEFDLGQSSEDSELFSVCRELIQANPDVVQRIKAGKRNALSFLLGQVMKSTQGTHPPDRVRQTLETLLSRA